MVVVVVVVVVVVAAAAAAAVIECADVSQAAATSSGRSTFSGAVAVGRPKGAWRSSLNKKRVRHSAQFESGQSEVKEGAKGWRLEAVGVGTRRGGKLPI